MNTNREQWLLVNLTSRTITTGFPFVRAIGPGKTTDLLSAVTKDDVRQSKGIALLLERAWARIDKVIDGKIVTTITKDNIGELSDASLDANSDGSIDLQGEDINLNVGTGEGGGNVNLEGGSVVFNNQVSLSATGQVISANADEFVTAGDLSVYGDLNVYGLTVMGLPDSEPNLIDNNSFVFYQDGSKLVLKARNKDGKTIKIEMADFNTDGE